MVERYLDTKTLMLPSKFKSQEFFAAIAGCEERTVAATIYLSEVKLEAKDSRYS